VVVDDEPAASLGIAPPFVATGQTAAELAEEAFRVIVAAIGSEAARELWREVSRRPRGRPARSVKEPDWWLLPGLRRFERAMPGSSLTQVVTAFVRDAAARGHRVGASEEASIRRLVRFLQRINRQI
jgi:hypothetical protein